MKTFHCLIAKNTLFAMHSVSVSRNISCFTKFYLKAIYMIILCNNNKLLKKQLFMEIYHGCITNIKKQLLPNKMIKLLMEDVTELEDDDDLKIAIVRKIINKELSKIKCAVRFKDYFENVSANYPESPFKLHFCISHTSVGVPFWSHNGCLFCFGYIDSPMWWLSDFFSVLGLWEIRQT